MRDTKISLQKLFSSRRPSFCTCRAALTVQLRTATGWSTRWGDLVGDDNTRIISARKKSERRKAERFALPIESFCVFVGTCHQQRATESGRERCRGMYGALLLWSYEPWCITQIWKQEVNCGDPVLLRSLRWLEWTADEGKSHMVRRTQQQCTNRLWDPIHTVHFSAKWFCSLKHRAWARAVLLFVSISVKLFYPNLCWSMIHQRHMRRDQCPQMGGRIRVPKSAQNDNMVCRSETNGRQQSLINAM